jgi:hypothetical protein
MVLLLAAGEVVNEADNWALPRKGRKNKGITAVTVRIQNIH